MLTGGLPTAEPGQFDGRQLVAALLEVGLEAADPAVCVQRWFEKSGASSLSTIESQQEPVTLDLLAVGKAAPGMLGAALSCARAATAPAARGRAARARIGKMLTVCPQGLPTTSEPNEQEQRFEAEHPLPGPCGREAAQAVVEFVSRPEARRDGRCLLVLLSGGASSLLPMPSASLTLATKRDLVNRLLRAGADIYELNCVRSALSRVKAGRLAEISAYQRTLVLVLSDVVGDDLGVIGSGPFFPSTTRGIAPAMQILERHLSGNADVDLDHVRELLALAKPPPAVTDPCFADVSHAVIGSGERSLEAMARMAREQDCRIVNLGAGLAGEARVVARDMVSRAATVAEELTEGESCVLLAAGETTVTVSGDGLGGRNQELALAVLLEWQDRSALLDVQFAFGSLGTDGVDGPTDAAGALVDSQTLAALRDLGSDYPVDLERELSRNNSHQALRGLGCLIRTGPTGTNVGDLVALALRRRARC